MELRNNICSFTLVQKKKNKRKIDNVEKQLSKKLDWKSKKLLDQLIECHNQELNDFAFRAYFDGISFATTILMNSLDDGD